MTFVPEIVVLCGGLSSEREVSLRSGQAVSSALPGSRLVELATDALPDRPLTRLPDTDHVDAHALARVRTFLAAQNTFWQRARRRLRTLSAPRPS